ncbi:hypothetical protein DFH06DRAFT_1128958 [Mycena polygramma]|nr:hypothetical protein DFH06DRAFT_1128958 [Mycena polygramma]
MAAAQSVFCVGPVQSIRTAVIPKPDTNSIVIPTDFLLDSFWRRVSDLTTIYHDTDNNRIGGDEMKHWNRTNRSPCSKCTNSKAKRVCIIDEGHPSCRACRKVKIGCDRKPLFVYEMTKTHFFPSFDQFMSVFHNKERGKLRRYVKAPAGLKRVSSLAETGSVNKETISTLGRMRKKNRRRRGEDIYPGEYNERQIRYLTNQLLDMVATLNDSALHPDSVDERVSRSNNHIKREISVVMDEIRTVVGGLTEEGKHASIVAI